MGIVGSKGVEEELLEVARRGDKDEVESVVKKLKEDKKKLNKRDEVK